MVNGLVGITGGDFDGAGRGWFFGKCAWKKEGLIMDWIGTKAVAEILGVSVSTVQRMAKAHRLFAVRVRVINGRRRFNRRDIEWFAEIRTARG